MNFPRSSGLGIIISSFLPFFFFKTSALNYKDLEDLDISCAPADTCIDREFGDSQIKRSCNCDKLCSRHGSCCIDSLHRYTELPRTFEECTWVKIIYALIYIVTKCSHLWDGPERTKELCEGGIMSPIDPVSVIPVTSALSGVTYANIFCSMCNMEEKSSIFWHFAVFHVESVDGKDNRVCAEIIPRVVIYTNVTGEWGWGYTHKYKSDKSKFIPVHLQVRMPPDIEALITKCFADCVSQCAEDWVDEEVKQKCESYMAAIKVSCALCNHVTNLKNASCIVIDEMESHSFFIRFNYRMILSFPYKLPSIDCLLSIAGIKPMTDLQDCRTVICDPGYEFQSGKCMPAYRP